MALFGDGKRIAALQAENTSLRQWVERLEGTDAMQLSRLVSHSRAELEALRTQVAGAQAEVAQAQAELAAARRRVVETHEEAILQEVGIYAYRHPLDSAVAYRARLDHLKANIKAMISSDRAATASTIDWTVNNSKAQGQKMVRDLKKLMLRAYNAEADNAVRALKPHTLDRSIERLGKVRETIARLGASMFIRIADEYHQLRIHELELTADYLTKVEEEKERVRAERERQREEAKALREFELAKAKLRKEQAHYQTALAKALASGDETAAATLRGKLQEIGGEIAAVEARAANTRTGYVYVISNIGAFGQRMVKVGMTRRLDPMDRVRELGDASVPFRFDTHALIFSHDAVDLENRLHQALTDRRVNRVNSRREFFYASPTEVRDILAGLDRPDLLLEFNEVAEAIEWRASGARLIPTQPPADGAAVTDAAKELAGRRPRQAQDTTSPDPSDDDIDDDDELDTIDTVGESPAPDLYQAERDSPGAGHPR
jgi:hypothetical protein